MPLLDANGLRAGGGEAEPVPNTSAVAELLTGGAELIAIAFPAFTDGRGFSLAKALRDAGYRGRLRASGELIPEQFPFALDCGFDEVEISDERLARQPVAQWLAALEAIDESYQASARVTDIFARRRAARAAA
jgi:uncharacterized protein (DUF934 family)